MTLRPTEHPTLPAALAVRVPTSSPWGPVQHAKSIIPGVWSVSTAGHGGLMLDAARNASVPEPWREADGCYEEDEAWCLPWSFLRLSIPAHWNGEDYANSTLRDAYPEAYERLHGVTLRPGESRARDEQAFRAEHKDALQVICAFGDWKEGVPAGMVGVIACPGGQSATREQRAKESHHLVDAATYTARLKAKRFGLLIDDAFKATSPFV